jgi:hypothetical protein
MGNCCFKPQTDKRPKRAKIINKSKIQKSQAESPKPSQSRPKVFTRKSSTDPHREINTREKKLKIPISSFPPASKKPKMACQATQTEDILLVPLFVEKRELFEKLALCFNKASSDEKLYLNKTIVEDSEDEEESDYTSEGSSCLSIEESNAPKSRKIEGMGSVKEVKKMTSSSSLAQKLSSEFQDADTLTPAIYGVSGEKTLKKLIKTEISSSESREKEKVKPQLMRDNSLIANHVAYLRRNTTDEDKKKTVKNLRQNLQLKDLVGYENLSNKLTLKKIESKVFKESPASQIQRTLQKLDSRSRSSANNRPKKSVITEMSKFKVNDIQKGPFSKFTSIAAEQCFNSGEFTDNEDFNSIAGYSSPINKRKKKFTKKTQKKRIELDSQSSSVKCNSIRAVSSRRSSFRNTNMSQIIQRLPEPIRASKIKNKGKEQKSPISFYSKSNKANEPNEAISPNRDKSNESHRSAESEFTINSQLLENNSSFQRFSKFSDSDSRQSLFNRGGSQRSRVLVDKGTSIRSKGKAKMSVFGAKYARARLISKDIGNRESDEGVDHI